MIAMPHPVASFLWRSTIFWAVVLLIGLAAIAFALLMLLTEGWLISLVITAAILVVLALFHYLVWGRSLLLETRAERRGVQAQRAWEQVIPEEQFTLILSDRERAELIEYLRSADKPSIRDIVERLRAFTV